MYNNENKENGITIEELTNVTGGLGRRQITWTCPQREKPGILSQWSRAIKRNTFLTEF